MMGAIARVTRVATGGVVFVELADAPGFEVGPAELCVNVPGVAPDSRVVVEQVSDDAYVVIGRLPV